jgi:hypothetical protein
MQVSIDELENYLDNFENFMYSNFDTQYITYGYEFNLAGDFLLELPSLEQMEQMLDWDYEEVMEYLDDNFDIEALLYDE